MDNFLTIFKGEDEVDKTIKIKDELHSSEKKSKSKNPLSHQKTYHMINTLQTESNANF